MHRSVLAQDWICLFWFFLFVQSKKIAKFRWADFNSFGTPQHSKNNNVVVFVFWIHFQNTLLFMATIRTRCVQHIDMPNNVQLWIWKLSCTVFPNNAFAFWQLSLVHQQQWLKNRSQSTKNVTSPQQRMNNFKVQKPSTTNAIAKWSFVCVPNLQCGNNFDPKFQHKTNVIFKKRDSDSDSSLKRFWQNAHENVCGWWRDATNGRRKGGKSHKRWGSMWGTSNLVWILSVLVAFCQQSKQWPNELNEFWEVGVHPEKWISYLLGVVAIESKTFPDCFVQSPIFKIRLNWLIMRGTKSHLTRDFHRRQEGKGSGEFSFCLSATHVLSVCETSTWCEKFLATPTQIPS